MKRSRKDLTSNLLRTARTMKNLVSSLLGTSVLTLGLAIAPTLEARAAIIGPASDYNVFIFDDITQYGGDVQGKVAVGGNADFINVGIADRLPNSNGSEDHLIVGGDLSYNGGQVFGGNAVVGGTTTGSVNFNCSGCSVTSGSPIDFDYARTYYSELSATLGNLSTTGTSDLASWGGLTFDGGDNAGINVFETDFQGVGQINLNTAANAELIVINVTTDSLQLPGGNGIGWFGQMWSNGSANAQDWTNVIWNFTDATSLDLRNISWKGTILAPEAEIKLANGNIEGQVVAKSASLTKSSGEFHNFEFTGSLEDVDFEPPSDTEEVPEPGTIVALLGVGLILASKAKTRDSA